MQQRNDVIMIKLRAAVASAILCSVLGACFGDGGVEVSGRVRDSAGHPVRGANVYIETRRSGTPESTQRVVATDNSRDDGCFDVGGTHVNGKLPLRLHVEAAHFKPYTGDFESGFFTNDVVLLSDTSGGGSTGHFVPYGYRKAGKAPCQQ